MEIRKQKIEYGLLDTRYWIHFFRHSACSRGFSLLELLIYIAILAGLMVVVSDAFISLSKGRGQSEARSEVHATSRFVAEKIRQDVKGASVVSVPVFGSASSTLNVTVGGTVIIYDVFGGQLQRKEGVASPVAVSGPSVVVSSVTFVRLENYNPALSATTTAIQVAMTVSYNASSTDWAYSEKLRTTISLR